MPRKNPVAEEDIAIGSRLAEARKSRLAPRTAAALELGISMERLASYESGRVPLPFWVGHNACKLLDISHAWLATGRGSMGPVVRVDWERHLGKIPERASFREVFHEKLEAILEERQVVWITSEDLKRPDSPMDLSEMYQTLTTAWFALVPPLRQREFAVKLSVAAEKIFREMGVDAGP